MSSTASRIPRVRPPNGAALRTVVSSSSTTQSSTAVIATICWASTSSGLSGIFSSSIWPARMRSATTADWTRSPWYLGKMMPREMSPTLCPARPTRCRPLATEGGASTWMTRSTAPMSMPSSRLEVATTAGSWPALSASSISARSSRETEPWWARATSAGAPAATPACAISSAGARPPPARPPPAALVRASSAASARSAASSFSRPHRRSASRREFANTIVDLCCSIRSSTRSSTCGQIERRGAGSPSSSAPRPGTVSSSVMSSTGTTTCSSIRLGLGGCTMVTGWLPPRKLATSWAGRTVADRPTRCAGRPPSLPWPSCARRASRRSSDRARCAPRLLPATACTSSRMTVSTPRRVSLACEVSSKNNDSGVVIRMSGGLLASFLRSSAAVSPVRTATWMSGSGRPSRCVACLIPVRGARRFRSMSTARAFSGET